jgi:hypothetical protein
MNPNQNVHRQLKRIAKSRLALSTVVTTLIVLVVAVLLAGVVTYFAINVTSTRVQEESLALAKQHVWFDYSTGKAQAAIMVINAGGRDVVVGKLTVRGQVCAWSKVFYTTTSDSISGDLFSNSTLIDGGSISVGGQNRVFKQATNDLTLQSGRTLIIYLDNPDSISVNDVGLTVSVNIFTSQAMYYKETNVQGTGGTTQATSGGGSSAPTIEQLVIYKAANSVIGAVIHNGGATAITAHDPQLNGGYCGRLWQVSGSFTVSGTLEFVVFPGPGTASISVQGHTLAFSSSGCTIQPGQTGIIYFEAGELSESVGSQAEVTYFVTGGTDLIQTATIQSAPG